MSKYVDYLKKHTGYRGNSYVETQDFMESATRKLCILSECEKLDNDHKEYRSHYEKVLQGAKELYFSQFDSDPDQYVFQVRCNFRNDSLKHKDKEDEIMSNYRDECKNLSPSSIQENMTSVVKLLHETNNRLLSVGDSEARRTKLENQRVHYERMLQALSEAYDRCPALYMKQERKDFLFSIRRPLLQKDIDKSNNNFDEI